MHTLKNRGISIIEMLIVISIITIIAAIVMLSLSSFHKEQTLSNTTQDIISFLNTARNDTLSSLNSENYGVHFDTNQVVYFTGPSFDSSDSTNKILPLDSSVTIPSSGGIALNGGGSEIIFTRLTGETSQYGTIIVRLVSDATRQKTITITKTGSVSSN